MTTPLCIKVFNALSTEVQEGLKHKKTNYGVTLEKILKNGHMNPEASIGCYAGDSESYTLFAPLFDGVIYEYHKTPVGKAGQRDLSTDILEFESDVISSTRIRLARNLEGYPFESSMTCEERASLEEKVLGVIRFAFTATKFEGNYHSLPQLSEAEKRDLVSRHLLFKEGDNHQDTAGITGCWPKGRGSYVSRDEHLQIWINEEDHLRVMYLEKGSDIKHVAKELFSALTLLETNLSFAYSSQHGYLTSCPTNIGSTMRASIFYKTSIPETELKKICKYHGLSVRGTGGEGTKVVDGVFDISLSVRFGYSEKELLNKFVGAVNKLAQAYSGWSPLHFASKDCQKDIVEGLLRDSADPNARPLDGTLALGLVSDCPNAKEIVGLLLEYKANPCLLLENGPDSLFIQSYRDVCNEGEYERRPNEGIEVEGVVGEASKLLGENQDGEEL